MVMDTYHCNLFKITRNNSIRIHTYTAKVDPFPRKRPLFYKIMGTIAKDLTNSTKNMVISDMGRIKVYLKKLDKSNCKHEIQIKNMGTFTVELQFEETRNSSTDYLEEYSKFVNRLFDLYLLHYNTEFRKFYPHAPKILKYEPTFDKGLIENTGIWDVKEYYRGIRKINDDLFLILDRNTILTSHKNLLVELKTALKRFERYKGKEFDFNNPPPDFISYINSLYIGKPAYVKGYPGPRVNRINQISWKYRCKDITPGNTDPICSYFATHYGIKGLDPDQPLIKYEIVTREGKIQEQYHVPELLTVNHNFRDLRMIVSSWQRAQVWDYIQPNCKNQLREIYTLMKSVDEGLKRELPEIYGGIIKINPEPEQINKYIIDIPSININFKEREIVLEPIYSDNFYKKFSASTKYYEPVPKNIDVLLHVDKSDVNVDIFIEGLKKEFRGRNERELNISVNNIDFNDLNYLSYNVVITVSDDNALYNKCKKEIQNKHGIMHQNIRPENIEKLIFVPLTLQLTLALNGNPWVMKVDDDCIYIGMYSYKSHKEDRTSLYYNIFDEKGSFVKQSDPFESNNSQQYLEKIMEDVEQYDSLCFISYYDRLNILSQLHNIVDNNEKINKYIILHVKERNNLRFFKTWRPQRSTPRRRRSNIPSYPFESYEQAPQGVITKFGENQYNLITSRSVERKDETFRGCPSPISIEVVHNQDMSEPNIIKNMMNLCFMTKTSGHMTRLPAPLEYLRTYAGYIEKHGLPSKDSIKNRLYYL